MTELLAYQEDGAAWLAPRARAGLLDEPGVGKTAQAVRAADKVHGVRGIVICPAAVREHWRGEFRRFGLIHRRVCKGQTIHDYVAWSKGLFDVLVCSYELATKWAPYIEAACEPLDFGILDEAHYLKEPSTARAKAILGTDSDGVGGIIGWCRHAWWLTGTPIPNDPLDIFTFLRFAGVMPLDRRDFTRRYFKVKPKTYSTSQTIKPEMVSEIRALIGNNTIRRRKVDIGLQLPPIWMTSTLVDGDTSAVLDLLRQHPGLDKRIIEAVRTGSLARMDEDCIPTLRRLIGEAKAVAYGHMIMEELNGGLDKVVVFGIHRAALLSLHQFFAARDMCSVVIQGGVSETDRQKAMHAFQNDPACRIFIGNIKAAGTGLTLTASAALDMLESDWTPAGNSQAIMRVHRITQTRAVRARFITLANSFDETVNEIVAQKTAAIAEVEGFKIAS